MANLLATKAINTILNEAQETGEHCLKRALGPSNLIALGIGAIIGTGIFVITGTATAQHAGPAVILSFIFAAIGCVFAGLCYAEFSSMIPVAGSAYTYGYATLGEIFAWIIGWDLVLEYAFGAATVASGWSGYFISLLGDFGVKLPASIAGTRWDEFIFYNNHWENTAKIVPKLKLLGSDPATLPHAHGVFNLLGFLAIAFCTLVLVIGIKESANFNTAIVAIKVLVLMIFIGIGGHYLLEHRELMAANWHPFIPPNQGAFGKFGWSGVFQGATMVFFAYIGFDAVSTAAQEAKNPQRDLPIGILASLAICTVLYIVVSGILTGVVPYAQINIKAPIAAAMGSLGINWAQGLIATGAIFGITTVMLVLYYGLTRVVLAMSRDGLLPAVMAAVHPKSQTPVRLILGSGVVIALIAGFFPIGKVAQLVNLGTLGAFFLVCASVIVLRKTRPALARPFKTPWVPLIPILGMGFCGWLMVSLPAITWIAFVIWMTLGLTVYFVYSYSHSTLSAPLSSSSGA